MNNISLLPPALSLYLTYQCQLHCEHCFLTKNGMLNKYALTVDEIKSIINEAIENKVFMIRISGGDPLLHPGIYNILEMLKNNNILALLGITGVNITVNQILKLKELGVPCIQVSLDGADESKNSYFRGPNVFDEVINTIKLIKSFGIHANLAFCISRINVDQIENMLTLAERTGVYKVKIAFLEHIQEDTQINEQVLSDFEKNEVVKICKQKNQEMQNDWIAIPGINLEDGTPQKLGKYPPLVIGADGSLRIDEFGVSIGHIKDGKIADIYGDYIKSQKKEFLNNKIEEIKIRFNIKSIEVVNSNAIFSVALVYKFNKHYNILIRENTPDNIKFFSILHEAAHIAQGTLNISPYDQYDKECELNANIWAIEYLKPFVTSDFYNRSIELAYIDEAELFNYINNNLTDQLIGYWSDNNEPEIQNC